MSDFRPISDEDNIWLRPRQPRTTRVRDGFPWGSWICGITCVVLFLLIHATGGYAGNRTLAVATYPAPAELWEGAFWGPLTSAFVHFEPMHLLFNLLWLKILGPAMEKHFGTLRFLLFVTATAYLTSTSQLAVSDNAGIGFSGVNYALFGFLWIARHRIPDLQAVITPGVTLFMFAWLVIAPFISKLGLMPIGNAAHNSGVVLGILAGAGLVVHYKRALTLGSLGLLCALLLVPLFYLPWSVSWHWNEGLRDMRDGRFADAVAHYDFVLSKEPGNDDARHNRTLAADQLQWREPEPPPARGQE